MLRQAARRFAFPQNFPKKRVLVATISEIPEKHHLRMVMYATPALYIVSLILKLIFVFGVAKLNAMIMIKLKPQVNFLALTDQ